jgi:K+-sensing histidine kinase KdpD
MNLLWRIWATVACIAIAGLLAFVFHSSPLKEFIPFLFIPVIAFTSRFGTWVGILGTIGSMAIFATFLFEPGFSLRVSNSVQRDNLVWMVIGGVALSEILGVQPPTRSKSEGKGR